jgi:hypothetical protein
MTENQETFLKALDSCLGIVSDASEMSGISRTTHYRWLEESEEYAAIVKEMKEGKRDFVESALMSLVREKNPTAVIFACKTILRDRGYAEIIRHEGTGNNGAIIFKADYGSDDSEV